MMKNSVCLHDIVYRQVSTMDFAGLEQDLEMPPQCLQCDEVIPLDLNYESLNKLKLYSRQRRQDREIYTPLQLYLRRGE